MQLGDTVVPPFRRSNVLRTVTTPDCKQGGCRLKVIVYQAQTRAVDRLLMQELLARVRIARHRLPWLRLWRRQVL